MDWYAEQFRQPIAAVESRAAGSRGRHPREGHEGDPKGVRLFIGQPRLRGKPTLHFRDGWSN